MLGGMRMVRVVAVALGVLCACNNPKPLHPKRSGETIRYRLLLRNNPVSSADAAHCFSACQSAGTPNEYVDCLSACPGFESTPGEYCSSTEVPPEAACITVIKIPAKAEVPPGLVALAIVGGYVLAVGASSLCRLSSTHCGVTLINPQ
jgi:hypothetical protein